MYRIICTAKIILHMKWSGIMVGSEDVQDSKYVWSYHGRKNKSVVVL
jgi:hypothetical protein